MQLGSSGIMKVYVLSENREQIVTELFVVFGE